MPTTKSSAAFLAEALALIDEAATANGGWLSIPAYTRWRAAARSKGRKVPSHQAFTYHGIDLAKTIAGMGISTRPPGPTDEELLAFVAQAHAEVGTEGLARQEYQRWQSDHEDAPSAVTLIKRLGNWTTILAKAGVSTVSTNRRYGNEDLLRAMRAAAEKTGVEVGALTMAGYDEWRRGKAVELPSVSTISNRFGSWLGASDTAAIEHTSPD